jgi:hypothetical protein
MLDSDIIIYSTATSFFDGDIRHTRHQVIAHARQRPVVVAANDPACNRVVDH